MYRNYNIHVFKIKIPVQRLSYKKKIVSLYCAYAVQLELTVSILCNVNNKYAHKSKQEVVERIFHTFIRLLHYNPLVNFNVKYKRV